MMKLSYFAILLLSSVLVFGCAKKADPDKPIDQIKSEVQNMNLSQLESEAKAYARAIESKKSELEKIQEKLKEISPAELFSDKAKEIKNQASAVSSEVKALSDRYSIYVKQFEQLGGDLSKVRVS